MFLRGNNWFLFGLLTYPITNGSHLPLTDHSGAFSQTHKVCHPSCGISLHRTCQILALIHRSVSADRTICFCGVWLSHFAFLLHPEMPPPPIASRQKEIRKSIPEDLLGWNGRGSERKWESHASCRWTLFHSGKYSVARIHISKMAYMANFNSVILLFHCLAWKRGGCRGTLLFSLSIQRAVI